MDNELASFKFLVTCTMYGVVDERSQLNRNCATDYIDSIFGEKKRASSPSQQPNNTGGGGGGGGISSESSLREANWSHWIHPLACRIHRATDDENMWFSNICHTHHLLHSNASGTRNMLLGVGGCGRMKAPPSPVWPCTKYFVWYKVLLSCLYFVYSFVDGFCLTIDAILKMPV
jgi:hypothetical protein